MTDTQHMLVIVAVFAIAIVLSIGLLIHMANYYDKHPEKRIPSDQGPEDFR